MHFIVGFCTKWFLLLAVTLGYTWRLGVFLIAVILGKTMRKLRLCCQIHEWWGRGHSWPFRIFHKVFLCKIYILAISMTRKKKQKACSRKHRNILCGAERLRAHDALPEDQMSVSSPYQVSHNCLTISRPLSQHSYNCLTISRPLMPSSGFHGHLHTQVTSHILHPHTDRRGRHKHK